MFRTSSLLTAAADAPSVRDRNRADSTRQQFSVLCWRGWCDNDFRDRDIAALAGAASGQPWPTPTHLPKRECPMPDACQCVCHDPRPGHTTED